MMTILLSGGASAIVDDRDYELVIAAGSWHARAHGYTTYAQRHIVLPDGRRSTQQMHLLLCGWPGGVDHVNLNGLDNRRCNLRPADQSHNMASARLIYSHNTSGYRGVTKPAAKRSWVAQIRVNGKQMHIGSYPTPEEAARAYDAAALDAWGEFARLNFPPP